MPESFTTAVGDAMKFCYGAFKEELADPMIHGAQQQPFDMMLPLGNDRGHAKALTSRPRALVILALRPKQIRRPELVGGSSQKENA